MTREDSTPQPAHATILVMTVGGSPEGQAVSLRAHCPRQAFFIVSKKSRDNIKAILEQAGLPSLPHELVLTDDPSDLARCFEACNRALDMAEGVSGDLIADPTGGTKLMSAALALACADRGATMSYVSGERDKGGLGTVQSGTETVLHSAHPFDLIARAAKQRLVTEFNAYRFESAALICRDLKRQSSARTGHVFGGLLKLCEGYAEWERFNHHVARQKLASGLNHFERYQTDLGAHGERLRPLLASVRENVAYLDTLSSPSHLYSLDRAVDLCANAHRRIEEDKYDDAVARLYRALEMIAQARFVERFGDQLDTETHSPTSRFPLRLFSETTRKRFFPDK
ncbi:MAG: TIGR02710 family CRISPR-associated protein, partial [Candidatus Zixiibacteriota bacterium]